MEGAVELFRRYMSGIGTGSEGRWSLNRGVRELEIGRGSGREKELGLGESQGRVDGIEEESREERENQDM